MNAKQINQFLTLLSLPLSLFFAPTLCFSAVDFLVEPYLGYALLGNTSVTTPTTDIGGYSGIVGGARVGVQFINLIFVAVDGSYYPNMRLSLSPSGTGIINTPPSSVTPNANPFLMQDHSTNLKIGLTAGVNVPVIGVRAWLGYNLFDQVYLGSGGNNNSLPGSSFKAGLGWKFLNYFGISAEYIVASYSTVMDKGGGTFPNPLGNVNNRNFLLSVSAPLTF